MYGRINIAKLLIGLLFLLAGALLVAFVFYPIPTFDEIDFLIDEQNEVTLETSSKFGEPGTSNTWKTSKNHFTIEVPFDWEVNQRDRGGMSTIHVYDPEDSANRLEIVLELSSSINGRPTEFEPWMNNKLIDVEHFEDCDSDFVGDEEAICFIIYEDDDDNGHITYFGKVDSVTYFKIQKHVEEFKATPLQGVLNTLNFNPEEEDLLDALIIP